MREHLPRFAVPLLKDDPDLVIDLQRIFTECYANGGFSRHVDYSKPIDPPLRSEDLDWANSLLAAMR